MPAKALRWQPEVHGPESPAPQAIGALAAAVVAAWPKKVPDGRQIPSCWKRVAMKQILKWILGYSWDISGYSMGYRNRKEIFNGR